MPETSGPRRGRSFRRPLRHFIKPPPSPPAVPPWPPGFQRLPAEPWLEAPVDAFARDYDALQHHTWYANLDPTVAEVAAWAREDGLVLDYSGGTGILEERLLAAAPGTDAALLNVDASAKFLRLAAGKLGGDPRCGFRLLPFLAAQERLQTLEETAPELAGRVDGVVCANAIHLYPDPASAMRAWRWALRPGGRLHVQTGNAARAGRPAGLWVIDATVRAAAAAARAIVRREPRYAAYREALDDPARMAGYDAFLARYFPPVRGVEEYARLLEAEGFRVEEVREREVPVRLDEWTRFLSVYHEGILPWIGGTAKTDGRPPAPQAVQDRLVLLAEALRDAVGGPAFTAQWCYLDAVRA